MVNVHDTFYKILFFMPCNMALVVVIEMQTEKSVPVTTLMEIDIKLLVAGIWAKGPVIASADLAGPVS